MNGIKTVNHHHASWNIVRSCHQNDSATLKLTIIIAQEAINFPTIDLFSFDLELLDTIIFSCKLSSSWMRIFSSILNALFIDISCIHLLTLMVFDMSRRKGSLVIFFIFWFLPGYPHIFLKDKTSPVRGSWLPLLTSVLSEDQTCVLFLVGI